MGDATHWNKIWTLRVIPKIRVFLWKTLYAIIPTKINLIGRFLDVDLFCVRCGADVEIVEHVFRDCEWVRKVWDSCPITLVYGGLSLDVWVRQTMRRLDEEAFCHFATVLWTICFTRNLLVFQGKQGFEKEVVVDGAMTHRRDFFMVSSHVVVEKSRRDGGVKWRPPGAGTIEA